MNDLEANVPPISVPQSTNDPKQNAPPASSVVPVTPITPSIIATPELKWITHLSSLIVVLAAAAYLIGFVVVNSHLFSYGMVPYDFSQPRYISAGLLYLVATVGLTSIVLFLIHVARKSFLGDIANAEIKSAAALLFFFWVANSSLEWLLPKSENIPWWLQSLRYPSIALAFGVSILNTKMLPIHKRLSGVSLWWTKHLWEEGRLFWIVLGLVLVYFLAERGYAFAFYPVFLIAIWLFYIAFRSDQRQGALFKEKTDGLVYGLTFIGLSVYAYATLTYPQISPHVGGGKPLLVSLSLKPGNDRSIGKTMGREDWKCIMHNISLIHENSELIYVLPHGYYTNESAIAIPKSELVSIAYQKKETKDEPSTCLG
jgi:hypothetical protein